MTVKHGSVPPIYDAWCTRRDALLSVKLLCCAAGALLPERYWKTLAARLARLHVRVTQSDFARFSGACEQLFGITAKDLERGAVAASYEENMEAIREILPGSWHPRLSLVGRESLDAALQQSRGAILWISPLQHSDFVTKKALAEAGYSLNHLSAIDHPFSGSRFGVAMLNPIRLRAENRYLARRVRVVYGRAQPALAVLIQALKRNEIVSITAVDSGRSIEVPLFGATLRLAAGAPMLALRTGATLLPVFTLSDKQGGYTVHIGPNISVSANAEDPVSAMAARYALLLAPYIAQCPVAWKGWFSKNWMPRSTSAVNRKRAVKLN